MLGLRCDIIVAILSVLIVEYTLRRIQSYAQSECCKHSDQLAHDWERERITDAISRHLATSRMMLETYTLLASCFRKRHAFFRDSSASARLSTGIICKGRALPWETVWPKTSHSNPERVAVDVKM
jgi:hypothetical protein